MKQVPVPVFRVRVRFSGFYLVLRNKLRTFALEKERIYIWIINIIFLALTVCVL